MNRRDFGLALMGLAAGGALKALPALPAPEPVGPQLGTIVRDGDGGLYLFEGMEKLENYGGMKCLRGCFRYLGRWDRLKGEKGSISFHEFWNRAALDPENAPYCEQWEKEVMYSVYVGPHHALPV